jgi:hypothetical protein
VSHGLDLQEKQKQDAAAANGKVPRQSAGELRVQKGANMLRAAVCLHAPIGWHAETCVVKSRPKTGQYERVLLPDDACVTVVI